MALPDPQEAPASASVITPSSALGRHGHGPAEAGTGARDYIQTAPSLAEVATSSARVTATVVWPNGDTPVSLSVATMLRALAAIHGPMRAVDAELGRRGALVGGAA